MTKNIVLCCDGTANEFARDRTNVVKLFHALVHTPAEQVTYYHPGVGTMEAVGAVTTTGRKITKLLGLAIGYGLETDIRDAYVFLMNHFKEGDRLFLFGFSRGAYTVRCPLRLPFTADNHDIAIGRHAVALDERRAFFRTNLWRPSPDGGPKDLKQMWFPGVHCDIGGGYPEAESGLSKIALQWILDEAKDARLIVDPGREALLLGRAGSGYAPPDPQAKMHESLTGLWRAVEFVPKRHYNAKRKEEERRMNLFRHRTIPPGASTRPPPC